MLQQVRPKASEAVKKPALGGPSRASESLTSLCRAHGLWQPHRHASKPKMTISHNGNAAGVEEGQIWKSESC